MQKALILLLKLYRVLLSPYVGQHCRFVPSCSCYAIAAIQTYGAARGGYMALRRLLRCHPWCAGGFDPLPGGSVADSAARSIAETDKEASHARG
ncbi:MAG: membrane protein insertion efficiency factor YidD [Gammaproteobacteria bacterium]